MNNNFTIGAGWVKETKDGKQMISFVGGDKKNGIKLFAETSTGDKFLVENFMVFFNDKDSDDPRQARMPDVRAVVFPK